MYWKTRKIFLLKILVLLSFSILLTAQNNKRVFYMGYTAELFIGVDLKDAQATIQLWSNEMMKKFNYVYEVRSKIFKNNSEIIAAYENDELDILALLSLSFFEIEKQTSFIPIVNSREPGKGGFKYSLLVRKDSKVDFFDDLSSKKIILSPVGFSLIADLWLSSLIDKQSISKSKSFFSVIERANKVSQAVLSVFFKNHDVCLVPNFALETIFEMNPQLNKELRALEISDPLINSMVCIKKNIDPQVEKDFLVFIDNLKISTSGKLLTSLFGIVEMKKYDEKALEYTRKLFNEHKNMFEGIENK